MSNIVFSESAWEEYLYWQTQDKRTLKKINSIFKDILRNGYKGIAKPEPLKGNLSGFWSREIDEANRIVYRLSEDRVEVIQCKGHYNDK